MPKVVLAEPTPNENAMKFTIEGKTLDSGSKTIKKENASDHPIAEAVYEVDAIVSVFLLNDFVTVTKDPSAEWSELRPLVIQAIESV